MWRAKIKSPANTQIINQWVELNSRVRVRRTVAVLLCISSSHLKCFPWICSFGFCFDTKNNRKSIGNVWPSVVSSSLRAAAVSIGIVRGGAIHKRVESVHMNKEDSMERNPLGLCVVHTAALAEIKWSGMVRNEDIWFSLIKAAESLTTTTGCWGRESFSSPVYVMFTHPGRFWTSWGCVQAVIIVTLAILMLLFPGE